jgi:hypothetical protein
MAWVVCLSLLELITGASMFTDLELSQKYINKSVSSKDRGIEFSLSFSQFKNIMNASKCQLSGLPLTKNTVTIDRVDNNKGYITGNCVACDVSINKMKGVLENPQHPINIKTFSKALNKTLKLMEKQNANLKK